MELGIIVERVVGGLVNMRDWLDSLEQTMEDLESRLVAQGDDMQELINNFAQSTEKAHHGGFKAFESEFIEFMNNIQQEMYELRLSVEDAKDD